MDLRQLRYFTAIVEQGSFSKAATKLRVAQPALSQHLRHMEDELGVALLHRGTRGVLPTEAGERLLARARAILADFAELRDSVRGEAAAPGGEVRIGLPGTVSEQFSVPLIEAARERYPAVRIRIAEAMSGFVLDWLRRGEVDLAVIYSTSDPKGLGIHHVLTEELCLFGPPSLSAIRAAPGSAVGLAEAAAVDLILPGVGHGLRDQIDEAAASVRVAIQPAIEIESYAQIKRLAERGLGYGILRRWPCGRRRRPACSIPGGSRSRRSTARSISPIRPSGRCRPQRGPSASSPGRSCAASSPRRAGPRGWAMTAVTRIYTADRDFVFDRRRRALDADPTAPHTLTPHPEEARRPSRRMPQRETPETSGASFETPLRGSSG